MQTITNSEGERVAHTLCPPWCTQVAGDHECTDSDGLPVHYGPTFGTPSAVGTQGVDGQPLEALVWIGVADASCCSDPAELRRVAAAMLEAAAWMESHA